MDQLTDAALVESARTGEMSAYEELYRRYFDRAYDFAVRTTRNRERAADAAQEAFIKAHERLGQLRDPAAFQAWLFSIVRRETIAGVRSGRRETATAPLESGDPGLNPLLSQIDEDIYDDPVVAAELADSADLVWEAAASLDPDTYTILDLHVRHGLSSSEIADVLEITKGSAYTRLNRMKERTAAAISTYLLIRKGSNDCEDLAGIVAGVDVPPVTPGLRKTVDRHVRDCEICTERRKALVAPLKVFAALGLVPAPAGLQQTIWDRIESVREGLVPGGRRRWPRYAVVALFVATFGLASGVAVGYIASQSGAEAMPDTTSARSIVAAESTTTTSARDSVSTTRSVDRDASTITSSGSGGATTAPQPATTTDRDDTASSLGPVASTTTTSPPDTDPPVITQVDSTFDEIWEQNTQSLSCPPANPRVTDIVAVVDDAGSGVALVEATWSVGGNPGSATLSSNGGTYFFEFGPYPYLSVPDNTSPTISFIVRALDNAGNESKDTVAVVLHSTATCFG